MDEVDVLARGVQDVADEVALDRVARARTLVVRHDALCKGSRFRVVHE